LRPRIPWLVALLLSFALSYLQAAQTPKLVIFPNVSGYNLAKDKVIFPSGMQGQTDLLLISFAPEQQKDIDSWLPVAQALQHTNFQFRWYELPISNKENFVFRWWETSSIRSDQTDPETWPWVVPLFVDRHKFREDLAIPNPKQVVALLVNRQGRILWRASGPLTSDKRASLMAAAGTTH
jgi:ATP10 protein